MKKLKDYGFQELNAKEQKLIYGGQEEYVLFGIWYRTCSAIAGWVYGGGGSASGVEYGVCGPPA